MGSLQAMEIASSGLPIEVALGWHLSSNHYPPVSHDFVPVAVAAIEAVNRGDVKELIDFPEGYLRKNMTAGQIVEELHLDFWLIGIGDFDEELTECGGCGMPVSECVCD